MSGGRAPRTRNQLSYWVRTDTGAVASSACLAICYAVERATNLRTQCPYPGFRSVVICPTHNPSSTSVGMTPSGQQRTHLSQNHAHSPKWGKGDRTSFRKDQQRPPFLAVRKQSRVNGKWFVRLALDHLRLNGTLGSAGRQSTSVKALNVARSPGATVAPSNACHPCSSSCV